MARSSEVVPRPDDDSPDEITAPGASARRQAVQQDAGVSSLQRPARNTLNRGASNAALMAGQQWRRAARWLGLLIFMIGAGLLAYVFLEALRGFARFSQPDYLSQQIRRVQGDGWQEAILASLLVFGTELLRVGYLIVLGVLGSMIAGKGIQFFSASESVIDEAVVPGYDDLN